jgi:hypothetical protein
MVIRDILNMKGGRVFSIAPPGPSVSPRLSGTGFARNIQNWMRVWWRNERR